MRETEIVTSVSAVLWDFGGVFTTSPFKEIARFERDNRLPDKFVRSVISYNREDNPWEKLEAGQISLSEFDRRFSEDSESLGYRVSGKAIIRILVGSLRPRMIRALATCKNKYKVGCITNNVRPLRHFLSSARESPIDTEMRQLFGQFDTIVESCVEKVRKPDPRIYEIACERLGVMPDQCVFLDDLGMNLKAARNLGMFTIRVAEPDVALTELSKVTGLEFD